MIRVRRLTALVLLSLAGAAPVAAQSPAAKPAVTEGDFKIRGGIRTIVTAEHGKR